MKPKSSVFFQALVLLALSGTAIIMSCSMGHRGTNDPTMNTEKKNTKTITVTGTALHAKAGAVVETSEEVYYIKGKHDWGELYGKKVKVTGTLETVTTNTEDLKNEKGEYVQGFSGTVHYIADAKVEEVK